MKKLLLSVALGLASVSYGFSFNTQSTSTANPKENVEVKGAFMLGVDASGNVVPQQLAPGGASPVTGTVSTLGYIWLASITVVANASDTAYNVTSVAGYSGRAILPVISINPGDAIRWDVNGNTYPSAAFTSTAGPLLWGVTATANTIPLFPLSTSGTTPYLHFIAASGVTPTGTVYLQLFRKE